MHMNRTKVWFCLAFWLINNLSAFLAAPQHGQGIDLGILKLSLDLEDGFKLRKEVNIDTPVFKLRRTGEIGFGNPMVPDIDSDSDSEEETFGYQSPRAKRAVSDYKSTQYGNLVRRKRAPCFGANRRTTTTTTVATPADGGVEAARRRNARRTTQTAQKTNGRRSSGRRRRQVEIENFNTEGQIQNVGKSFSEHVDQALLKIRNLWESTVQATTQLMQTVRKTFSNA